jgi:acetate kinase
VADALLAINAGSSSLKFGLFEVRDAGGSPHPLASGVLRERGQDVVMEARPANGTSLVEEAWPTSAAKPVIELLLDWLESQFLHVRLLAVGHRIVHGGTHFGDPIEIDDAVLEGVDALTPLAPLHQPISLEPVRRIRTINPELRQFACFDTAFHRTIGPPASRYALPRSFEAEGIHRYGFHGLSYESIAEQLKRDGDVAAADTDSRIIVAHLGNGASLCAMRGLMSVDTTMGFSTLDGLPMGSRCGTIDPGVLLYLMQERGFSVAQLEQLLYRESGLVGVSGISSDVATLLKSDDPAAAEALDLFAFQVARHVAALAATLGGIDRIIFTGGIGEQAPAVRRMIAQRLTWLGAGLDDEANMSGETTISTGTSSIVLERRSTQEELMIARHVMACLQATSA